MFSSENSIKFQNLLIHKLISGTLSVKGLDPDQDMSKLSADNKSLC